MKFKIGLFSVLVAVFMIASSSLVLAAAGDITVAETNTAAQNIVPNTASQVIGSYTFTAAPGGTGTLKSITLDGATAGTLTGTEITRVAIYNDIVGDGMWHPSATLLMEKTATADINAFLNAGTGLLFDFADVSIAASTSKKYLFVIDTPKVLDDTHVIQLQADFVWNSTGTLANQSPGLTALTPNNPVVISATHLVFATAGYNPVATNLGANVVTNGDFSAVFGAAWTGGGNWVYNSNAGVAEVVTPAAGDLTSTPFLAVSTRYVLSFQIKNISAGTITPKFVGTAATTTGDAVSANGVYTQIITSDGNPAADQQVVFSASANFVGQIDNVSLRAVATGTNEIVTNAQTLLRAVDDYDNLCVTYTAKVKFKLEDYLTGSTLTSSLYAVGASGANRGYSIRVGDTGADGSEYTADDAVSFAAGLVPTAWTPGAGAVASIASTTSGNVVLVAVDANGLEGSVTITNSGTRTVATGVAGARGVELYDTDHNGRLDRATIFFNGPVNPNAVPASSFSVAGYSVISTAPAVNVSNGGVGIRNAGEFGITIYINEITSGYDTNAKPEVTYNGSLVQSINGGNQLPTINTAQAVEVDRMRPILLSAYTRDSGIGTGIASNGKLDGIVLTFSEPVVGYTAGPTTSSGLSINASTYGYTFNQGNGTLNGTVLTIPVGETSINTGSSPSVVYNKGVPITDAALSATGTSSPNTFYPNKALYTTTTSFTVTDGAPMVVYSVQTQDSGGDGKIDKIKVTFSEAPIINSAAGVDFYSDVAAFASGIMANGTYTVDTATAPPGYVLNTPGQYVVFDINPVTTTGVYDTEAVPKFRFDPTVVGVSLMDGAGNNLSAYGPTGLQHPATIDGAPPVIVAAYTRDAYTDTTRTGVSNFASAGPNGRLDTVEIVFSEQVTTGNGAANGGTALDNAIAEFAFTHQLVAGARGKFTTANALGQPVWTSANNSGDTSTTIKFSFTEIPFGTAGMTNNGDTGLVGHTLAYTGAAVNDKIRDLAATPNNLADNGAIGLTDGAAPFIVDGLGKFWYANGFANILTIDSNGTVAGGAGLDTGNGDGYIDGIELKFSENVVFKTAAGAVMATGAGNPYAGLSAITAALPGGNALTFSGGYISVNTANDIILYGTPDKKGDPNTDATPPISFSADNTVMKIFDTAATPNQMVAFANKPSYDAAKPVIVSVYQGATPSKLNINFSEPVYGHYTGGERALIDSLNIASSTLFGYDNQAGPGATGFATTIVTRGASANQLVATLNADLTAADIASDRLYIRADGIWDDANAVESSQTDNFPVFNIAGTNIKINVFDDVVAPWIIGATTVDYNGNGLIDHIKFTFSESVKDASFNGYVSANAMSNDVSAVWKVSGYTGPARWNFFDGTTNAGKTAAIAAGKPAFADNGPNGTTAYLELDETLVPVYPATGMGSTGFKPTITWGIGANAQTTTDMSPRANLLDTASTATSPAATNGTVADAVGPVLMRADAAGQKITLYFSEAIKDTTLGILNTDFATSDAADGANNLTPTRIWSKLWINPGTLELTMKSDFAFLMTKSYGIQIGANNPAKFNDAYGITPIPYGAPLYTGVWTSASTISSTPYPGSTTTKGYVTLSAIKYLTNNGSTTGTVKVNTAITLKWTYANIDSVDVYVSYNSGLTYTMLAGSRVAASAKTTTLVPKLGMTNWKVQSATDSGANFTGSISVVFDGNNIGASIGAPSALAMYDVPNDNGGFLYAKFAVSSDHLTVVKSYQFEREVIVTGTTKSWVLWATVAAGAPDDASKMTVIVPTIWNDTSKWRVRASTGQLLSDAVVAAKEATVPVADVVYGAAGKAAGGDVLVSVASDEAEGTAIDNIAPSAVTNALAVDNEGAGTGILVSWAAGVDHGVVATYTINNITNFIYGVNTYEVYRRVAGTTDYAIIGSASTGATSYIDKVVDGSTVYEYVVKALDGTYTVATVVPGRAMAGNGTADFSGDGAVSGGDLVLLGKMWGIKSTDPTFVVNYDLNKDGVISGGDLVLLGKQWTGTKTAKAAPAAGVTFNLTAQVNEATSMYYVNVSANDIAGLEGLAFTLNYDTNLFEFVKESVTGLGVVSIANETKAGVIDIGSAYVNEKFNGAITLGFKSKGKNSDMNVEMVNAEVVINDVVGSVDGKAVTLKALPTVYALAQNFPNPFNPTTTIEYSVPTTGHTSLVVYNLAGQKVRTLVNETQAPSFYKVVWDGKNNSGMTVATGTYFYKLVSGNYSKIVKMTLIK